MEFKRIDDTKFQCLLYEEDLEDNNISLDDFFRNDTDKIHGLLDVILEEAQKNIGVILNGGVMSLQLAPQPNHSILLTISSGHDEFSDMIKQAGQRAAQLMSSLKQDESNVIKREDVDDSVKAAPFVHVDKLTEKQQKEQGKETSSNKKDAAKRSNAVMLFQFASMQEAEEFVVHCPKTWGLRNSLYKDAEKGNVYLILERTRCSIDKFRYICGLLTEFSEFISSKKETTAYIMEHYSLMIENNAINIMKKYCI